MVEMRKLGDLLGTFERIVANQNPGSGGGNIL